MVESRQAATTAAGRPAAPPRCSTVRCPTGCAAGSSQIVSDGFGGLTVAELPAQLRQYARFTPTRRAKFAGNAMAAALETDPLFRQRIAEKLQRGPAGTGRRAGRPARRPRPRTRSTWRPRPTCCGPPAGSSWSTAAGEEAQRADAERADEESRAELERLREELDRGPRADHGPRPSGCAPSWRRRSKEAESLHRKLRSALSDVKRGEAALRKAAAPRWRPCAPRATPRCPPPRARPGGCKARLGEAEAALEAGRRAAREGRSVEDMRLRLLLDTVLDAAQGLRRELALPPVVGAARPRPWTRSSRAG